MPDPSPLDVDEFLAPIAEDDPSGPDLRWEDDYSAIESAREEEEDAANIGAWKRTKKRADWEAVIALGLKALKEKSKDIQIAAWVAEALGRRRGLAGLRDGLRLVRAIQDAFWATAHPSSGDLELREGVYDFLDDPKQLPLLIRNQPLTRSALLPAYSTLKYKESREVENEIRKKPDEPEIWATLAKEGKIRAEDFDKAAEATDVSFLAANVARLDECLQAVADLNASNQAERHYGRKGPGLNRTLAALEEVRKLASRLLEDKRGPEPQEPDPIPEPGPEPEPDFEPEPEPDLPAEPRPRPSRVVRASGGGPIADAEDAHSRVVAASTFLREADPADPTPILLVRALRAGPLYRSTDLPSFPAPAVEDRQALRRLDAEEDWAGLLDRAESVLSRDEGTGWLDARRLAVKALENLGHDGAVRAALALIAAELRDFPTWPMAEFDDGTPCSGAATRAWIDSTFPADRTEAPAYVATEPDVEDDPGGPLDPWDSARALLDEGKGSEAIEVIGRSVRGARTGRERFLRTFQQAELCLMLGRSGVALPLLEGLARQIDELKLDHWEDPSLCARVVAALYRCSADKDDDRARAIYGRLCQLDAGLALTLDDRPGS